MGRWQALIDDVIADLVAETPGEGLRTSSIDHKIWKAETRASNLAPATLAEKSTHRKREFQAALRLTLGALRVRDPTNEIWAEALHLLENPQLRILDESH